MKLPDAMIIMLVFVLLAIFGLIFGSSDQARQKITKIVAVLDRSERDKNDSRHRNQRVETAEWHPIDYNRPLQPDVHFRQSVRMATMPPTALRKKPRG